MDASAGWQSAVAEVYAACGLRGRKWTTGQQPDMGLVHPGRGATFPLSCCACKRSMGMDAQSMAHSMQLQAAAERGRPSSLSFHSLVAAAVHVVGRLIQAAKVHPVPLSGQVQEERCNACGRRNTSK